MEMHKPKYTWRIILEFHINLSVLQIYINLRTLLVREFMMVADIDAVGFSSNFTCLKLI